MAVRCADCNNTGVIGAGHTIVNGGDYCHCKLGQELQEEMSGCGNMGTEAECHEHCEYYNEMENLKEIYVQENRSQPDEQDIPF